MMETNDACMPQIYVKEQRRYKPLWFIIGLMITVGFIASAVFFNQSQLFVEGLYDSYAYQSWAWRQGLFNLTQNIPHLELAIYKSNYYVSFPPFPSIIIWLLQWVLKDGVPSGLLCILYALLCYPLAYCLATRYVNRKSASLLAFTLVSGGSLLDVAVSGTVVSGGVWYQAQTLAILLTLIAFYGVSHERKLWRFFGWLSIAFAVGCRPFQGIYIPYLVWMRARQLDNDVNRLQKSSLIKKTVKDILPYWVAPLIVATALGWYNWIRFGSPLEFGHNYLPEFTKDDQTQFALRHIGVNLFRILRPPFTAYAYEKEGVMFPITYGFAAYLTNPLLTIAGASLIRRKPDTDDLLLLTLVVIHFALLLAHRTFGGWQYGTRYICDMMPALLMLRLRSRLNVGFMEGCFILILAIANLLGTIMFHIYSAM